MRRYYADCHVLYTFRLVREACTVYVWQQKNSTVHRKHGVAGCSAGLASVLVLQPLDVVKTRLQGIVCCFASLFGHLLLYSCTVRYTSKAVSLSLYVLIL